MASSDTPSAGMRPNQIIDSSKMAIGQWFVIAICIIAMAIDGYDVMSIALAASSLKEEWQLSKAELGLILPMEFLGMAIGAIFMGSLSDFLGRKRVLLSCLLIISIGMAISAVSQSMLVMGSSRVFTGVGIGGTLATVTAFSSEYSNSRNRALAVILVAGGYTLGVFFAGKLGGHLLETSSWRSIFYYGAAFSLLAIPPVIFFIPESIALLEQKQQKKTISNILKRFGHRANFELLQNQQMAPKIALTQLFQGQTKQVTIILLLFYFGQIFSYYYFVKWMPPEVVELGFSEKESGEVLASVSLWGLVGSFAMAGASRFIGLKPLMIISLLGAGLSVAVFPFFTETIDQMKYVGRIAGFWLFAVISGAFGMFALSFPQRLVASGSGLILGIGRGGAMAGPWMAGILFASGLGLAVVSPIMAMGSFIAGIALLFLPNERG